MQNNEMFTKEIMFVKENKFESFELTDANTNDSTVLMCRTFRIGFPYLYTEKGLNRNF